MATHNAPPAPCLGSPAVIFNFMDLDEGLFEFNNANNGISAAVAQCSVPQQAITPNEAPGPPHGKDLMDFDDDLLAFNTLDDFDGGKAGVLKGDQNRPETDTSVAASRCLVSSKETEYDRLFQEALDKSSDENMINYDMAPASSVDIIVSRLEDQPSTMKALGTY